jgi:hypothetical protein
VLTGCGQLLEVSNETRPVRDYRPGPRHRRDNGGMVLTIVITTMIGTMGTGITATIIGIADQGRLAFG